MAFYEIYFSPTGGTKQAAWIVSSVWDEEKKEIDLSDPKEDFSNIQFLPVDICVVAVPSFGGRVVQTAAERLIKMSGAGAKAILLCVYGNRAYEDTLLELQEILEQRGFQCMGAIAAVAEHSIMRQFAAGRPDEQDREELLRFAEKIKEKCAGGDSMPLKLPGTKPYREYHSSPMKPEAGKACVRCGKCAAKCPVQAIPADNPSLTDETVCIACMRCISICPAQARSLDGEMLSALVKRLEKACAGRKSNELFL